MNDARLYGVIRAPRVSEKTARLQEISNQYAFEIAKTATKADIKSAVEQIFSVKVQAVNVVNVKGKNKAFRNRQGTRGDWRKAYVTLADGQSIYVMTFKACGRTDAIAALIPNFSRPPTRGERGPHRTTPGCPARTP